MTNLQTLDLSSNKLTGELLPEFSNMKALQTFNISSNFITNGWAYLLAIPSLEGLDVSYNLLTGSISGIRSAGDKLATVVLSGNGFDTTVSPADLAIPKLDRGGALVVDVRRVTFNCPFPTVESIKAVSEGEPPLVLRDPCLAGYGNFVVHYALPFLGALGVMYCAWQLVRRSNHELARRISRSLRAHGDDVTRTSHKRLKAIFVLSFAFMVYDVYNDTSVYKSMIAVVDNRAFENPCEAPNSRGLFYPSHVANQFTNADNSFYPDVVCDPDCHESNFMTYSEYLGYLDDWVDQKRILASWRDENVAAFAEYCESFYVVNGVHECAYSKTTGAEGCVRVKNVLLKNNRRFKKFIVASLTIVCMKELAKLLLVLGIWLRASDRKLGPCELGLIAESPFLLLLLWRRPKFLGELLLAPRSMKSCLLVFFFEDVCHSINLLAIAVYFAMYVDQQGIAFNIMQALFTSSLSLLNKGRVVAQEWWKEVTDLPEAHVNLSDVAEGQQEGSEAIVAGETGSCRGCGVGGRGSCWVGCGRWGCGRCSTLFRRSGAQQADAPPHVDDGFVRTNNPMARKTIGVVEMATVA